MPTGSSEMWKVESNSGQTTCIQAAGGSRSTISRLVACCFWQTDRQTQQRIS